MSEIITIAGDAALATFRQGLTGPYAFELLKNAGGRLLVQLAVGAGKTEWLVKIIVQATTVEKYDLVVVLVPRWDVINELLPRLPSCLKPMVLRPRPKAKCGSLDADWIRYERSGCGLLGRVEVCGGCPFRKKCFWPGQYGDGLKEARLIVTTQHHLIQNPDFIRQLRRGTNAERVLVLLDESDLLIKGADRTLSRRDLEQFVAAQEALLANEAAPTSLQRNWLEISGMMPQTTTSDLRSGRWTFPFVDQPWAIHVQTMGRQMYGDSFRFLGYDLHSLGHSDPVSRERLQDGGIRFGVLPHLGDEFMVFSGSMAKELARYRVDPDHRRPAFASPFEHHRFSHPQTRWYNIGSFQGAAAYFKSNSPTVLNFFAHKIAANIQQGRRTLLVCKKKMQTYCQVELGRRLKQLGVKKVKIVTSEWAKADLSSPTTLPLITYGICGLNLFEDFDAAYCLTGYYVNSHVVAKSVYDIDAQDGHFPIDIKTSLKPRFRAAIVSHPDARNTILPTIAQGVLDQKESDVIVQAVGRVRPFTKPREVITFHAGELPGVRYSIPFDSVAQARAYFEIPTLGEDKRRDKADRIAALRQQGYSIPAVAKRLKVSRSTVQRYQDGAPFEQGQNAVTVQKNEHPLENQADPKNAENGEVRDTA